MDRRIRDRIRRIEKLELDLLSDEQMLTEKKELNYLMEALQQDLLRRTIIIAAAIISVVMAIVGLLMAPSTPMLAVVLVSLLVLLVLLIQYTQKIKLYNDLYDTADILFK
ncbi:hypothetical protein [Butyrivibrio sp. JL13D10]|uniref:hypothetical protein n=1 Tax=Butyrivibrio sp. JL13D10 TaxID=3236815 RepID=UPI0038B67A35